MTRLAFYNGFMLALETIRSHKLRAFLTVLGVIIGTGTIIGVGAIMTGFDSSITAVLRSFGPNSIIVFKFPVGPRTHRLTPEERTRKNLTWENAVDIARALPGGGGCLSHAFRPGRDPERALQSERHVRRESDGRGGGLCARRAGGHAPRAILHRRREPARAPVAVIGADIEKGLYANRGSHREDDHRGRPRVAK